jgi:hypothetical protein
MSEGHGSGQASGSGKTDTRYSFTPQFLCSSAIFACRCAEIEYTQASPDQSTLTEHLGLVTSAIMQSTAAVEAASAEVIMHGPGHHLGSNGIDVEAHKLLEPCAKRIEKLPTIEGYKEILRILQKPPMAGGKAWQDMDLLVQVRNELIHYKSVWGGKTGNRRRKLYESLRNLRLIAPPSFVSSHPIFFPLKFMYAASAAWSVHTAVTFINLFLNG